jgi:hypothetical protein
MLYIDEDSLRAGQSGEAGLGWWTTPYGNWRLAAEIAAMRRFPGFRLQSSGGMLSWEGWLESALASGARYRIRLLYPWGYPDQPPQVEIVAPELELRTPHLLRRNTPCLFRRSGRYSGYEPARTTAATMIAWTALWIHAYETWQRTGSWPGPED